ncbi:CTP synthase [Legionella cherrii]|uniref:CTP synthase n=1 Tax=Legionella cherrii TaxID=28084 RepID=A0A0W0SCG3_9GAMM|nr:gamma-glutamyl-gamma-aminobutyrate hydrolase family protein [Legionella cherrii]KTC81144.1 CTP synthase [Legionella cherrii]
MFQKFSEFLSDFRALNKAKSSSEQTPKFEFALDRDEKEQLKQSKEKPKIVTLYDPSGGTTYCDMTIEYFKTKELDVIPVTPQEGLSHPVFSGKINGIYLPGGPNVPVHDPSDPRKRLEGELTELAQKRDIPLLGICRGQQTVAHHHGYTVTDIPSYDRHYEHSYEIYEKTQDPNLNNRVVVEEGSQLYNALHYKLRPKDKSSIEYNVTCLHHQHVEESQHNPSLLVSGRGKFDRSVESLEKRTGKYYTLGLQHHPESVISLCKDAREEKIKEVEKKAEEARFTSNFFEPDAAIIAEHQYSQKLREVHLKSKDEKAARAELGFFSKQVKHHFLDDAPKKEQAQEPSHYFPCAF